MTEQTPGPDEAHDVSRLLQRWSAGDQACLPELIPRVEAEIRQIAHRYMSKERAGHTLQTTALVNEAYLKLVDQSRVNWQARAQFYGVAAGIMRRILVDHARGHLRAKRGAGADHLPIEEALVFAPDKSSVVVTIDDALQELAKGFPRQAKVVEMRYFGGASVEETAAALQTHPNTVIRDWAFAKAWLKRNLTKRAGQG
jgi:RNA polymerase sigma factor (TIGR02999 family)